MKKSFSIISLFFLFSQLVSASNHQQILDFPNYPEKIYTYTSEDTKKIDRVIIHFHGDLLLYVFGKMSEQDNILHDLKAFRYQDLPLEAGALLVLPTSKNKNSTFVDSFSDPLLLSAIIDQALSQRDLPHDIKEIVISAHSRAYLMIQLFSQYKEKFPDKYKLLKHFLVFDATYSKHRFTSLLNLGKKAKIKVDIFFVKNSPTSETANFLQQQVISQSISHWHFHPYKRSEALKISPNHTRWGKVLFKGKFYDDYSKLDHFTICFFYFSQYIK